jgi:hypothetical protein
MSLSWNEIKQRATAFTSEWSDACNEDADAKSFLDAFFNVFGITRKRVGTFEHKVKKLSENDGYIDLLWKGTILVEMKSKGKNLDKAFEQAIDYTAGLKEYELPKFILVSDFNIFRLYELETENVVEFTIDKFVNNVEHFGFIAGYQKRIYKDEDPVNIRAAELMGKLHDALKDTGYTGHQLEVLLVRLLFCLFADDTTIFERNAFQEFIEKSTKEDGSDLGQNLAILFQVLNKEESRRPNNLDESLAGFPFVNGKLFQEVLEIPSFDSKMRATLLECCGLDWGKISPAIFGSMFQSVMNPIERRNLGAHYTSEKNILKLIRPLFLDELWEEFESVKSNSNKLKSFHNKIASLRFLDPACGCGNFLVITYREIRRLELAILKILQGDQFITDIDSLVQCAVDRFHGIEYEEFPAQIAQVAMWLIDHQMNMEISNEFGQYYIRLPLRKSAKIVHGNALRLDWNSILEPLPEMYVANGNCYDYILGNPPFIGKQLQNKDQKEDIELILGNVKGSGVLDYVACWYIKAAQYLNRFSSQVKKIKIAFVSTNSISQGEQVGILWSELFNKYKVKIHFAHRTFSWTNEARGKAAVHVVIIGFSNYDSQDKYLYEYDTVKSEPHERKIKNINPYLVEASDVTILKRGAPLCTVPEISFGSMPNDGGHFLFTDEEKTQFLLEEPAAEKYFRPLISAKEFLNGEKRWCLWIKDICPEELRRLPLVSKRIQLVKTHRSNSNRAATKKLAAFPTLFGENRQPGTSFLVIPLTTTENRSYIPLGFFEKDNIVNNTVSVMPSANLYHFGVLSSLMHMAWVKYVCGRMKSDYRYSNDLVYNNFPWPGNATERNIKAIEEASQIVLNTREEYKNSTLADLYNPIIMPPMLVKAHQQLDKVVDLSYRPQAFTSETNRIEYLFEQYEKYTAGLFIKERKKKGKI